MANLLVPPLAQDTRSQAIDALAARLSALDVSPVLTSLVDLTPATALPLLAEQFHILGAEGWQYATTDAQRRALIKRAIALHRYKGTPWAIRQALASLGLDQCAITERPEGAHWAEFDLEVTLTDRSADPSLYDTVAAIVEAWKPARSHLRRLGIVVASQGQAFSAAATLLGDATTVYPFALAAQSSSGPLYAAAALHGADILTVYPH
jgi:phage tail P2-like protein